MDQFVTTHHENSQGLMEQFATWMQKQIMYIGNTKELTMHSVFKKGRDDAKNTSQKKFLKRELYFTSFCYPLEDDEKVEFF